MTCPQRPEEGVIPTGGRQLQHTGQGCRELNVDPLQEECIILTAKQSPQSGNDLLRDVALCFES